MEKKFIIKVYGKVQGVWFRKSAQQKALALGLRGFCKNMEDGSVYIEAEGDLEKLINFSTFEILSRESTLSDFSKICEVAKAS